MKKIDGQMVNIKIPNELLADIDHIAMKTGKTRATTIRTLLEFGVDTCKDMEKIGAYGMLECIDKAKEKLKSTFGQLSLFSTN